MGQWFSKQRSCMGFGYGHHNPATDADERKKVKAMIASGNLCFKKTYLQFDADKRAMFYQWREWHNETGEPFLMLLSEELNKPATVGRLSCFVYGGTWVERKEKK